MLEKDASIIDSKTSLPRNNARKISLIVLLALVVVIAIEAGAYWWLTKKESASLKTPPSPSEAGGTQLTKSEGEDLFARLPRNPETGIGASFIGGDRANIWGKLVEIREVVKHTITGSVATKTSAPAKFTTTGPNRFLAQQNSFF